jgi:hypothetical protein
MQIKPKIVIVGTRHRLQTGHSNYSRDQRVAFQELIGRLIDKHEIRYVAEEMTQGILSAYGVSETLVRQVALRRRLKHGYIDLSEPERAALRTDRFSLHEIAQAAGLTESQFAAFEQLTGEMREYVWLVRILDTNEWPTLFVCGANHATRVRLLFNSVGILAEVEENDYVP